MAEDRSDALDPLIERILGAASEALTSGLSAEQAEWALNAFRGTVLPYRLRFAVDEGKAERQARAEVVTDDLLADFADLPPSDKWLAVRRACYLARPSSQRSSSVAGRAGIPGHGRC